MRRMDLLMDWKMADGDADGLELGLDDGEARGLVEGPADGLTEGYRRP